MTLYAQDADYWETQVLFSKSMGEIVELLREHGVRSHGFDEQLDDNGILEHFTIVFNLGGRTYQITFTRLDPDYDRGRKSEADLDKQSVRQLGRFAMWMLKSVLAMARSGHPEALAPYMALSAGAGKSTTIQQAGIEKVFKVAEPVSRMLALPAATQEAEFEEVKP